MAKRKAARKTKAAKKSASRKASKRKAARPVARKKTSPTKKAALKKPARRVAAKSVAKRKVVAKKAAKRVAKRVAKKAAKKTAPPRRTAAATKAAPPVTSARSAAARPARKPVSERKAPSLNRSRRVVFDDDEIASSPPSSLDMDRTASAARSGRKAFNQRLEDHNETSPILTGGDLDADWESAYSVGDEAPGGDNPTPDQDIVDEIGRAVGNEYQDNEPLKGADKIIQRDKHRWELDPGSKEDFDDED